MEKIPFEDGTKIKDAVVEINEQEYTVTPAQYTGNTPLTAANLNLMQDNIEKAIDDTVLGVKISENTNGHMNQYLKLFTLSFESETYKANSVLFKLSSVQDRSLDMLCNLLVNKSSQENGIANVSLKIVEQTGVTDNVNNLIAVRETSNTISVYLKIISNSVTPELKIISYMKYATETLTISSEQYVDSLPSGTQYQAFSDDQIIQRQYTFKGLTFFVIKYKRIVEISINGSTDQSLRVNTFYDLQLDDIFKPLQEVNDNITLSTTEAGMIRITTIGLFRIYPWTNLASGKGFRYTVTYISAN